MALTANFPTLKKQRVWAHLADLSTAGSAFASFPFRGKITKIGVIPYNAVTVASSTVTAKIAGTSISGVSIVISTSVTAGSEQTGTPSGANHGNPGDNIEFVTDGGSTTTCPTMFWADIEAA